MRNWMRLLPVVALGCDGLRVSTTLLAAEEDTLRCPPGGCPNSPDIEVPEVGMHEFNLRGLHNLRGARITVANGRARIEKEGRIYELAVENGQFRGVHKVLPPLQGSDLAGAEIIFENATLPPFVMHIYRARSTQFVVGSHDPLWAYQLGWHELGRPPSATYEESKKICRDLIEVGEGRGSFHLLGLELGESVVFEGDRIDAQRKRIHPTWQPDWFTVGCAGTALAKLFMLRQTTVSSNGQSTPDERGAHLKMLVADYCGGGSSFTMPGEPLVWRSRLMDYPIVNGDPTFPFELEARWTSQGATCIAVPRLTVSELPHTFGDDVLGAVHARCPALPMCSNTNARDFDRTTLVTANP